MGSYKTGFSALFLSALTLVGNNVWASAELDRQFALESIGVLRSWDNVDGLFGDYVASAYQNYFAQQSRFIFKDLSKADSILTNSKIPYAKLIQDPEIIGRLVRTTQTESLIRTLVVKEGPKYIFTLEWLHSPGMEMMATTTFEIEEPQKGNVFGADVISETFRIQLARLINAVPFKANVTGRDQDTVTINIGYPSTIKVGDILTISTLDQAKKHPLLKMIVDWQLTPTGKVRVEQIEEGMAFGKVIEEESGREIARFQKVTLVSSAPASQGPETEGNGRDSERGGTGMPALGWIGGSLMGGLHQWQYSDSSVTNSGGGLAFGARANGEVWLTRIWFTGLEFNYSFWNFSQQNVGTGAQTAASAGGGVSGSLLSYRFDVGYTFWLKEEFLGPRAWIKLGYKSSQYPLPISAAEKTGPVGVGSVLLGAGGEVPVRETWGAAVNLHFRLISAGTATWVNDTVSGASDVEFYLGAYHRISPRLCLRGGLNIVAIGVDFTSGASISQKTITIGPSVLYYF